MNPSLDEIGTEQGLTSLWLGATMIPTSSKIKKKFMQVFFLYFLQVTLITDTPVSSRSGMTSASLIDPSLQRDLLPNQQRLDSLNPFADDM